MSKIYTIREACNILQIDATTLRRWDREGENTLHKIVK